MTSCNVHQFTDGTILLKFSKSINNEINLMLILI